jgi:hypothetical protein
VITKNIYGNGLLKVAGGERFFTPEGWNGILREGNGGGQAEKPGREWRDG